MNFVLEKESELIKRMVRTLRGRAEVRGEPLDKDCKSVKISMHEYGMEDNRKFCYGLMDMSTEEPLEKCKECKAFVNNAEPPKEEPCNQK